MVIGCSSHKVGEEREVGSSASCKRLHIHDFNERDYIYNNMKKKEIYFSWPSIIFVSAVKLSSTPLR
jgi:hypothetical protein